MQNNNMVSIIVPVYRTKRYLTRCVKSICNQSYKNFECILIDDGSPDDSGQLCDMLSKNDSRIKVIHKLNGGVSSARNAGLDVAIGKYVVFIDSDDWVCPDYIEHLVNNIENNDVQFAVASLDLRELKIGYIGISDSVIDFNRISDDIYYDFFSTDISCYPFGKIFINAVIQKEKLRFDSEMKYAEDALFVFKYLLHCQKICTSSHIIYHYNLMNNSSATKKYFENKAQWLLNIQKTYSDLIDKLKISSEEKNKLLSHTAFFRFLNLVNMYVKFCSRAEAEIKIYDSLGMFKEWLFLDISWANINDSKCGLRAAIYNKSCSDIYMAQKDLCSRNKLKKLVRQLILKLSTPFVEIIRDSLL